MSRLESTVLSLERTITTADGLRLSRLCTAAANYRYQAFVLQQRDRAVRASTATVLATASSSTCGGRAAVGFVDPGGVDLERGGAAAAVTEAAGDGAQVDTGGDELGGRVVAVASAAGCCVA